MKFKYYEIDNRSYKLEEVSESLYEVTLFEGEKFIGSWCFDTYAEALEKILSNNMTRETDEDGAAIDFEIRKSRGGFEIYNLNGEFLRRCKTKKECYDRIANQTV